MSTYELKDIDEDKIVATFDLDLGEVANCIVPGRSDVYTERMIQAKESPDYYINL